MYQIMWPTLLQLGPIAPIPPKIKFPRGSLDCGPRLGTGECYLSGIHPTVAAS